MSRREIVSYECNEIQLGLTNQLWHDIWSEVCRKKPSAHHRFNKRGATNLTYAVGSVTTMALAPMDMAAIAARASLQYILDNIFRLCDFVLWQWSRFEMDSEANNEAAAEMKRITNKMMKGI